MEATRSLPCRVPPPPPILRALTGLHEVGLNLLAPSPPHKRRPLVHGSATDAFLARFWLLFPPQLASPLGSVK